MGLRELREKFAQKREEKGKKRCWLRNVNIMEEVRKVQKMISLFCLRLALNVLADVTIAVRKPKNHEKI